MKVTSTGFRKNLFRILDRVLQGEFVEVAHKGRLIRLVPGDRPNKMSRLVQRDTILGTPEDIERGQQELDAEMLSSWEDKWASKQRSRTSIRTSLYFFTQEMEYPGRGCQERRAQARASEAPTSNGDEVGRPGRKITAYSYQIAFGYRSLMRRSDVTQPKAAPRQSVRESEESPDRA